MRDTPTSVSERSGELDWLRLAPVLLAAACFGFLAFALTAEFAFGYEPCSLCDYQRVAYGVAGIVALVALALRGHERGRTALIALCGTVLLAGGGVAFYHVGVEQHWWGAAFCAGGANGIAEFSFEDLRAGLALEPEKPCDEVDWTLLGLSMATYNVGIFFTLGLGALTAVRRAVRGLRP